MHIFCIVHNMKSIVELSNISCSKKKVPGVSNGFKNTKRIITICNAPTMSPTLEITVQGSA